jgi:hypothetical protein
MSWPSLSMWAWVGAGTFAAQLLAIAAMVAWDKEYPRSEEGWVDTSEVAGGLAVASALVAALWPVTVPLIFAVLIAWPAWTGLIAALRYGFRPKAAKKKERINPPEKSPRNELHIDPTGPDDSFCSCPKCFLLGNHAVEIRHHPGNFSVPGENGDEVILGSWASRKPGPYVHRTCWSCGNSWGTPADQGATR